MDKWLYFWVFLAIACAAMYFLYCKGIAVSKSIQAILFVFRPGKDADKATLDSCTGWVMHMGRFHENRAYEFTFDAQLSKGDAEVCLLDKNKQQLLKLGQQLPVYRIELDGTHRYYLRWEFKSATGTCTLHWQ